MKKIILKFLVFSLLFFVFIPSLPANAWGGYYTFRSTVAGSDIEKTGQYAYDIVDERYDFDEGESVYVLTRIFNITNVKSFRFKHEIVRNGFYKARESQVYRPNRRWWQETYYWYKFDDLPVGDYELKTYIQVDGECYRQINTKRLYIKSYSYYGDNCRGSDYCNNYYDHGYYYPNRGNRPNYAVRPVSNYYGDYRRPQPSYKYEWTETGKGIRDIGNYSYEITNQTVNFSPNDNVYALTKLSNLSRIDYFKVKHEVYRDGNNYYKSDESSQMWPKNNYWEKTYISSNLGKLPTENHEIRISISINGGSYKYLSTKQISVKNQYCDYYDSSCYNYKYDWSKTDHDIRQISNYAYDTINPKSDFSSNERVIVLSKIANIRGIDKFRVRHELYRNNDLIKTNDSDERWPHGDYWEYNYFWTDFGQLQRGGYVIKVYISINNGPYIYLDTKFINVSDSYYSGNQNYSYEGTQTGTVNNYWGDRRPINYN